MIYDLVIVGAGPAGITAAVYAARKRMNFIVITKDVGGQAAWSGDIENYTGYQFITGPDLVRKFEEHMEKYAITVKENEPAVDMTRVGGVIHVKTQKSVYETKALIIASGKISRELGVPGEKEFKNRGLTYCATCDGPLFSGKDVAVIGGGNSALDACLQLVKIAGRIYLVNITAKVGGDAVMREKIESSGKVTIFNDTQVTAILGDKMVSGIKMKRSGKEETLAVEGVFVEVGLLPNSVFAREIEKNEHGEIRVNCSNETNIPGIFAAGDVTDIAEKQIVIAAGEGSKAALAAFKYINRSK